MVSACISLMAFPVLPRMSWAVGSQLTLRNRCTTRCDVRSPVRSPVRQVTEQIALGMCAALYRAGAHMGVGQSPRELETDVTLVEGGDVGRT